MQTARCLSRLAILAVSAVLAAAPAADAQAVFATQVRTGPGAALGQGIGSADLTRYVELLAMDDTQAAAAAALHEVYEQESREAARLLEGRMQELREEMEDTGDFSVMMKEMPKIMEKAAAEGAQREATFLADLRTLLTEEQTQRWPKLERLRRRDQFLRFGMVSGDSVDLVRIVSALDLPEPARAAVADPLEGYELDMDRLLQERARQAEEAQGSMRSEDGSFRFDMEQMQKTMQAMRESGLKVRDLNRRHAAVLEAALPEVARSDFTARIRSASFPQVYRRPYAGRALEAALGFDDLSAQQRTSLADLQTRYERDLTIANDRWAREIEKADDEGAVGGSAGMGMRLMFGGPEEPESLGEARTARRELDRRTLDAVKGILTPEQAERLPDRSEDVDEDQVFIGGPGMRVRMRN